MEILKLPFQGNPFQTFQFGIFFVRDRYRRGLSSFTQKVQEQINAFNAESFLF